MVGADFGKTLVIEIQWSFIAPNGKHPVPIIKHDFWLAAVQNVSPESHPIASSGILGSLTKDGGQFVELWFQVIKMCC